MVTLITGTSRGIGRFLAQRYAERGHQVIGCSRAPASLEHPAYDHVRADVASEAEVKALLRHVREKHGRLDHLINNAGIASMNHAMLMPLDAARRIVAEIAWVQAEAVRTQQSQYIWFRPSINRIDFGGLKDPAHPSRDYVIDLNNEMSGVKVVSADFGGVKKCTFDPWGHPNAGGSAVISLGDLTWTITANGDTGQATTTE